MNKLKIISARQYPQKAEIFIDYFIRRWGTIENRALYQDCIISSLNAESPLPQWYLLMDETDEIIGGAGLITNDFISRMDLTPWLCALFIEKKHRGNSYGSILMEHIKSHAIELGFNHIYLCTDHIGYYEKYGFEYIGNGYHPWNESSRIYRSS